MTFQGDITFITFNLVFYHATLGVPNRNIQFSIFFANLVMYVCQSDCMSLGDVT